MFSWLLRLFGLDKKKKKKINKKVRKYYDSLPDDDGQEQFLKEELTVPERVAQIRGNRPTETKTATAAKAPAPVKVPAPAVKTPAPVAKPEQKAATPAPAVKTPVPEKEPEVVEARDTVMTSKTGSTGGKFDIKRTKDDRYVFNLYASNHVIIATSQTYTTSGAALNGIRSIIANAERSPIEDQTQKNCATLPYPKWELYIDRGGQFRFRLNAPNGSCIVHSQGYTTKSSCKKGIDSIIRFATDAEIAKSYLKKDDGK